MDARRGNFPVPLARGLENPHPTGGDILIPLVIAIPIRRLERLHFQTPFLCQDRVRAGRVGNFEDDQP